MTPPDLQAAADLLRHAKRPAVLTGAGMSAASGIPTFRDALTGMWAKYDPTELATPQAFRSNPSLVWDWYAERRERVAAAKPNPGHTALAALERLAGALPIITQNVDELHEAAGSTHVIHLHGRIGRSRCSANCRGNPTYAEPGAGSPPPCPFCGTLLRPDVVWFTETLPLDALRATDDALDGCDVLLVIGTSGLVEPAASFPLAARRHGTQLIEVNPDDTPISRHMHVRLRGPAAELLPELVARLEASA